MASPADLSCMPITKTIRRKTLQQVLPIPSSFFLDLYPVMKKAMKALFPFLFLLVSVSPARTQDISFTDRTQSFSGKNYHNNGVALVDYDGDGLEDIYVSVLLIGKNFLYKNLGNFIFQDYAVWAGIDYTGTTRTSAWGDIDNDGDPDLFIGNRDEPNRLYLNQGDGTFLNKSDEILGTLPAVNTTSVSMADVNNDGWLDIYVSNIGNPNQLFVNDGTGHFAEQAQAAGVDDNAVGMGAVLFDYDNDGDVDIYQVHDAQVDNILYQNDGTGHFQDVAPAAQVHYPAFSMGAEAGDVNNDGFLDIYVTNLFDNFLYQNRGDGTFEAVGGCNDPGMGWGSVFADFNNDRRVDLYLSNDYTFSPYDNALYMNTEGAGFVDIFGLPWDSPYAGYATIASDLDDDGKMDIVIAHHGDPGVQLLRNTTQNDYHFISFRLEGTLSNRDAIGSRLTLYTSAGVQYDQVISSSGYAAQNGQWIHFGLKDEAVIDSLVIHWPSGMREQTGLLQADQKYRLLEGHGIITSTGQPLSPKPRCRATWDGENVLYSVPDDMKTKSVALHDLTGKRVWGPTVAEPSEGSFPKPSQLLPGVYQLVCSGDRAVCSDLVFIY